MDQHLRVMFLNLTHPSRAEYWCERALARATDLPYWRQHRIGKYVVDLTVPDVRLAIEIDDKSHRSSHQKQRDNGRNKALSTAGWTLVRLLDSDIMRAAATGMMGQGMLELTAFLAAQIRDLPAQDSLIEFREDYYVRKAKERAEKKARAQRAARISLGKRMTKREQNAIAANPEI
ncbi:MAG: DUF559 domain-containing protein [Myxococcales bacterium]|nr:DUF559 domain-containing protein [Myxococcales bacterium]